MVRLFCYLRLTIITAHVFITLSIMQSLSSPARNYSTRPRHVQDSATDLFKIKVFVWMVKFLWIIIYGHLAVFFQ